MEDNQTFWTNSILKYSSCLTPTWTFAHTFMAIGIFKHWIWLPSKRCRIVNGRRRTKIYTSVAIRKCSASLNEKRISAAWKYKFTPRITLSLKEFWLPYLILRMRNHILMILNHLDSQNSPCCFFQYIPLRMNLSSTDSIPCQNIFLCILHGTMPCSLDEIIISACSTSSKILVNSIETAINSEEIHSYDTSDKCLHFWHWCSPGPQQ